MLCDLTISDDQIAPKALMLDFIVSFELVVILGLSGVLLHYFANFEAHFTGDQRVLRVVYKHYSFREIALCESTVQISFMVVAESKFLFVAVFVSDVSFYESRKRNVLLEYVFG